jgi:CBS-domain-containing membrane protein
VLKAYFAKMKGTTTSPPRVSLSEIAWSWLGAFLGIGFVAFANYRIFEKIDLLMIVGSFGASAVLIYGAVKSPLAQPRNLVGGHVLSALVGVACQQLFHSTLRLAAALAVSTAIAVMHATRTLHPPGGATALIAVIGGDKIHSLGFMYALFPVGGGALIMLIVALLVNNLPSSRRYPESWV